MQYMILEPHADDAFLSLGGHIKRWVDSGEAQVHIVTVYSTPKRAAEAAAYAESVGATHSWLGYLESGSMDTEDTLPISLPYSLGVGQEIIVPLGLRHTEHFAVREAADAFYTYGDLCYYVDQPYAMQLKNQEALQEKLHGKQIRSIYKPGARKYHKKYVELFKTQNMFFYFNKDILPATIEMIVK